MSKTVKPKKTGKTAKSLTAALDWVEAAARLRKIRETEPDLFLDAAKKLGVGPRKAYYLVEIDRKLGSYPISHELKLKIGWTKMQMLVEHISSDNFGELLIQAEDLPVHDFREVLEGTYSQGVKKCVLLYLSDEQYSIFTKALTAHGAKPGSRGLRGKEAAMTAALKKVLPEKPPKA